MDEIDAFLKERSSQDHEVSALVKAEFMGLWDGLSSEGDRILVLGATNRPTDIDAAILRRYKHVERWTLWRSSHSVSQNAKTVRCAITRFLAAQSHSRVGKRHAVSFSCH